MAFRRRRLLVCFLPLLAALYWLSPLDSTRQRPRRPHFAVVYGLPARPGDPEFRLASRRSLSSLAAQTHKEWTLVAAGDGLDAQQMRDASAAMDRAGIPATRRVFVDSPPEMREAVLYSDPERNASILRANGATLGWFAGISALNRALGSVPRHPTHIARLDDDDSWDPEHLAVLAAAFAQPGVVFAHTKATGYLPSNAAFPRNPPREPPEPCGLIHSSAAWQIAALGYLRYRQAWEQRERSPRRFHADQCGDEGGRCGYKPCAAFPADADMWFQMREAIREGREGGWRALFVGRTTVDYLDSERRKEMMEEMAREEKAG